VPPTDQALLADLGSRLARHRLDQNLSQARLAREAGVSKRTVERLENGQSIQLSNFLRILRALGLASSLDLLVPALRPSPMELLRLHGKKRRRASRGPADEGAGSPPEWTWGDERPEDERE